MFAAAGPFALGLLIGGMGFFSFIVAPTAFRVLPEAEAGRFVRGLFPHYYLFVIATAALSVVGLIGPSPVGSKIMVGVLIAAVVARQVLMPAINAARDRWMGGDASAKRRFGLLHGASVVVNMLQLTAAVLTLALHAWG
jgi:hypothetical protein